MRVAASTRPCATSPDLDENQTRRDGYRTVAISERRRTTAGVRSDARALFCTFRCAGLERLLMMYRIASVLAKTSVARTVAMVTLALTVGPQAFAQQPSTNPPVGLAQAAPGPNAGQAQQAAPVETVQNGRQQVQLIFSPWARYCAKGLTGQSSEIRATEVCFTAADGHLTSGKKLVIALLIEPEGVDTKLLRVTLPLGVALLPGARIVIDEKEAMTAPYVVCLPKNGCMADHKADTELIEKLKTGRSLAIQAFDRERPISFTLPLTGFAKAYDGPASDPTGLNELQEGLPNKLQSHSEEHLDTPDRK
jgi:invasion protein IalB